MIQFNSPAECNAVIEDFLENKAAFYHIHRGHIDNLRNSYSMVKYHIGLMTSDQPIPRFPMDDVHKSLDFLNSYCLERPLDEKIRLFMLAFCHLLDQWNQNMVSNGCIKENDIPLKIKTIIALVQDYLTMMEARSALMQLIEKAKNLSNWNPPSFELAKHFMDSFDEEDSSRKS